MSYRVDRKTMLFDDLTADETVSLHRALRELVLEGDLMTHPAFEAWCTATGEARSIMSMAVTFPQRALLSLVEMAVGGVDIRQSKGRQR